MQNTVQSSNVSVKINVLLHRFVVNPPNKLTSLTLGRWFQLAAVLGLVLFIPYRLYRYFEMIGIRNDIIEQFGISSLNSNNPIERALQGYLLGTFLIFLFWLLIFAVGSLLEFNKIQPLLKNILENTKKEGVQQQPMQQQPMQQQPLQQQPLQQQPL